MLSNVRVIKKMKCFTKKVTGDYQLGAGNGKRSRKRREKEREREREKHGGRTGRKKGQNDAGTREVE